MADAEESDYEEEADEDIAQLVNAAYEKAQKAELEADLGAREGDNPLIKKLLEKRKDQEKQKEAVKDAKRKKEEDKDRKQEEKQRRRWEKNYSSEDSLIKSDQSELNTYYCAHCGAYSLIVDVPLEVMPKRKTDGSTVLDEKRRTFHRMMDKGPLKVLKRESGIERQYRLLCKECRLPLCYRNVPVERRSKYCYIIKDALVDKPADVKQAEPEPEHVKSVPNSDPATRRAIKERLEMIEKLVEEHKDVLPPETEEPIPDEEPPKPSSKFKPLFPVSSGAKEKEKEKDNDKERDRSRKDKSPRREKRDDKSHKKRSRSR